MDGAAGPLPDGEGGAFHDARCEMRGGGAMKPAAMLIVELENAQSQRDSRMDSISYARERRRPVEQGGSSRDAQAVPQPPVSTSDRDRRSPEPRPSSSSDGFFQTPPRILNQLVDDIALQRALDLFLPDDVRETVLPDLRAFGDTVISKTVLDQVSDAEKNLPYLRPFDAWGRRQDELVTSEGWRKLSALGVKEGMVSIPYENEYLQYSRTYQFLKYLVWCGSAVWTTCPNQMTDGVAALLRKHLTDKSLAPQTRQALQSAYARVTSRDPDFVWTTGQWMTERQGGSDVSQTETLATYAPDKSEKDAESTGSDGVALGDWLVNGFKWFSSATDSQMMVFLARTPTGISTFMAPMRRVVGKDHISAWPLQDVKTELNGVQIQRLKNKLGTKALPTAELVLNNTRAHLIGEDGKGIKEMATVLNISRIHNGLTATGFWGRGLSTIRAFARVRKVGLKPLWTKPAFARTLAKMHVEYKANVLLGIFVISLLGVAEQSEIAQFHESTGSSRSFPKAHATRLIPNADAAQHLFRLLAPVLKGVSGKTAIGGLQECMECMGGVGYLESEDMQFNLARLFRDANVIPIWEGTTDMMADDVRRVVFGKTSQEVMSAMDAWVKKVLADSIPECASHAQSLQGMWKEWQGIVHTYRLEEFQLNARSIMGKLSDVVMGCLLVSDASRDRDTIAIDFVDAWFAFRDLTPSASPSAGKFEEIVARDLRVVFGREGPQQPAARL